MSFILHIGELCLNLALNYQFFGHMENLNPTLNTGNPKTDQTLTVIVTVALILSALNGLVAFIRFLEEREIARKKMRSLD
jgi:hypothetical protein